MQYEPQVTSFVTGQFIQFVNNSNSVLKLSERSNIDDFVERLVLSIAV